MSVDEIGVEDESSRSGVEVEAPPPPTPDILDTAEAGPRAVRGSAFRSGAYAVSLGLSLVSVPFMIRHLGAVDYGYFVTVSSIVFIIGGVSEAGGPHFGNPEGSAPPGGGGPRGFLEPVGPRVSAPTPPLPVARG